MQIFICSTMYLVVIAWLYVVVLMALAEALSHTGSVLGAIMTFFFYGLVPICIMVYLRGSPLRKKARRAAESQPNAPDGSGHATGAAEALGVAPVGKKPD